MTAGWATPTEAAALGASGTIVAAMLYRSLTWAALMKALTGTVAVSGTILFIIIGATTFSQVLSFSGATNGIVGLVSAQGLSATVIILGMMAILLFLGCFVDQVSMMLITLPFFMPLVAQLGVDPVWFGVLFLICMQLGLLTPPFGLLLFTMKGVAPPGITMNDVFRAALPYVWFGLLVLMVGVLVSAARDLAAGPARQLTPPRLRRRGQCQDRRKAGRMHEHERWTVCAAALAAGLVCCGGASAQDWPTRPVTMVVPYAPGGNIDQAARVFGRELSEKLGQQFIVESKGGAGGAIGAAHGGEVEAGRLHAAGDGERAVRPQQDALRVAALRSGNRFHADLADQRRAAGVHRQSEVAGV